MSTTWYARFFKPKQKLVIGVYSGIDELPLFNFEKILDGRPEYVLHNHELVKAVDPLIIVNAIDQAMDEYCQELEIDMRDDDYFIFLQKVIEYRDRFVQGDKSARNFVRHYEMLIEDLKRKAVKPDFVKNRMAVAKWNGHAIDPKKTTVREFLKIHSLMMDEVNARKSKAIVEDEGN